MQKRLATTLLLLVAAALCLGGQQARRGLASPLAGLAAEWAPDEAVLLLVNGTLARFHLKTEAEELLATDVAAFALSADGTRLALARGGRLEFSSYPELRTLGTVQPPARADGKGVALRSVAWSPDGQTLAAGTDDGRVLLWELASGELWGEIGVEQPRAVTQVSFSADGARLFSLFADGRGILWTLAERDVLSRFPPPEAGDGEDAPAPPPAGLAEVRLSPAGEHLLVTRLRGSEPEMSLLGADGGEVWRRSGYGVEFTPDGTGVLALVPPYRIAALYRAVDASALRVFEPPEAVTVLYLVRASPDGTRLLGVGEDHRGETFVVWDFATGQVLKTRR